MEKRKSIILALQTRRRSLPFDKWNETNNMVAAKSVFGRWRKKAQANKHLIELKKEVLVVGYTGILSKERASSYNLALNSARNL